MLIQTRVPGSSRATRSAISPAALFVKVIARTRAGSTPFSMIRAIRRVMTRVFPEPGPARTSNGPFGLFDSPALARCQIVVVRHKRLQRPPDVKPDRHENRESRRGAITRCWACAPAFEPQH